MANFPKVETWYKNTIKRDYEGAKINAGTVFAIISLWEEHNDKQQRTN